MLKRMACAAAGCVCGWTTLACSAETSRPRTATEMSPATALKEPAAPRRPFVIGEASLPKGFPGPGPVGEVIVKEYPEYRRARVRSETTGGPNTMFRPLFNHIQRNGVPMTAPVEMEYAGTTAAATSPVSLRRAESMAFLYEQPSTGTLGPDKADPRVAVEDVPAMTVVSIGIRGSYTDRNLEKALATLNAWLDENGDRFRPVGPPRYLAYNSPFVPNFLKFGEVQIPVSAVAAPTSRPAR